MGCMLMTVLLAPTLQTTGVLSTGSLDLAVGMLRELFVGYVCGFVFQIYYYMIFFAGDMGVSEQRIGQVNRKLVQKLREKLTTYMKG